MKKLIIAVVAAVALTALVPLSLEAGVGFKGGMTWSSLSLASTEPIPFAFGNLQYYAGGVFFDIGLGFVAIQPEFLYVRMGGLYEVDELNSLEFRHQYIQAPLLLRFTIIPAGPIRPFICAGGYGAYLLKSEGVMEIDGTVEKTDVTADYQRFDYGVVGSAGILFKLGFIGLSIEGRYNYGLANVLKSPAVGDAMKNRSLMALVGIKF
jgi:membrane-associated protease RseP (regulator of RpoE activity)